MFWNQLRTIGGKVWDVVENLAEDKDEANKLKFQIQRRLIKARSSEQEA